MLARATRGTKRPPFDAGGYERLDSDSSSDSDSDSESDGEHRDSVTVTNADYETLSKKLKRDR